MAAVEGEGSLDEIKNVVLHALMENATSIFWFVAIVLAFVKIQEMRQGQKVEDELSLFSSRSAVEDLYDDLYPPLANAKSGGRGWLRGGGVGGRGDWFQRRQEKKLVNLGLPARRYIQVQRLNDRYDSYQFSMQEATTSKAAAAAILRRKNFHTALGKALSDSSFDSSSSFESWTASQRLQLMQAEQAFLYKGREIVQRLESSQQFITTQAMEQTLRQLNVTVGAMDVDPANNNNNNNDNDTEKKSKSVATPKASRKKSLDEIRKSNVELVELENDFVQKVIKIVGPQRANAVRVAILGRGGGSLLKHLEERPLSSLFSSIDNEESHQTHNNNNNNTAVADANNNTPASKSVFQTEFIGDVTASQVSLLREEVTAILSVAQPGVDEVVLLLKTGGGTVTGYGLAAAQLQRLQDAGIRLTICVEEVAASGGYLMSCVADRIVASPFSVLGSIGVITDIPNVYQRLKTEGVEFQTVTAGKFKRTLTPTKKVTQKDRDKTQEDLEDVLTLFKSYVARNRPSLDIEAVATGETWVGTDALEKGLCDELATLDDVLLDYVQRGYNVYRVRYDPEPESGKLASLFGFPDGSHAAAAAAPTTNPLQWLVRFVMQAIAQEVTMQLTTDGHQHLASPPSKRATEKYLLMDPNETRDGFRFE